MKVLRQRKRRKKKPPQKTFFDSLDEVEEETGGWGEKSVPGLGNTVLDRIHQSMILFAAGRSEALKRFLVEDGVGRDARYWRLAQALSALYPTGTDEKRWVDGVLAQKEGARVLICFTLLTVPTWTGSESRGGVPLFALFAWPSWKNTSSPSHESVKLGMA